MNRYLLYLGLVLTLFGNTRCGDPRTNKEYPKTDNTLNIEKTDSEKVITNAEKIGIPIVTPTVEKGNYLTDFLPSGYIIFEEIFGDLNKDGIEDCVIIIKGTENNKIIQDEYRGELDRNRRGIIVLFKRNDGYHLAAKNYDCFSSENEDGGVYYAPELSVKIDQGNLYVNYAHGRYGYWRYTFRFQNSDFELIGYDESMSRGPVVIEEISINYSTKTKIIRVNTNENGESGEEVFEETVTKIGTEKLTKLSEIKDFDNLIVLHE